MFSRHFSHVADGLGDHILDILDLNDAPIMTSSKKKRDGRISTFMARLYQQIEEGDAETRRWAFWLFFFHGFKFKFHSSHRFEQLNIPSIEKNV